LSLLSKRTQLLEKINRILAEENPSSDQVATLQRSLNNWPDSTPGLAEIKKKLLNYKQVPGKGNQASQKAPSKEVYPEMEKVREARKILRKYRVFAKKVKNKFGPPDSQK